VVLLIGFSSIIFGAAHVLSGWTAGKLVEASYGGLVLGYVYVKYGFHVAVMTHWGFDFVANAFAFFGQGVAGIAWNSPTSEYVLQAVMDYDLVFVFGLASFLVVAYAGAHALAKLVGADAESSSEVHKPLDGEPVGAR
jgi:hypothetical protein